MRFTTDDKNWLTLSEGKELYNISYNTFRKLAIESNALVYWGTGNKIPRVNRKVFEEYFDRLRG